MISEELIKAVAATAELCGRTYTPEAARMLAYDLEGYDERAIMQALSRCRKELKPGQFCLEAIVSRIDDGRPGPEEAWAMIPQDEYKTVVWTDEMREACSVAGSLIDSGDSIAARMAFREAYIKSVTRARSERIPVRWEVSLGLDKAGREPALIEAVEKGRLPADHVMSLLPYHEVSPQTVAFLESAKLKMLKKGA